MRDPQVVAIIEGYRRYKDLYARNIMFDGNTRNWNIMLDGKKINLGKKKYRTFNVIFVL